MSEWWTYTLSDFLLFSPRTYYRLIERHNAAVWPAHLVALGVGLGVLGLLCRPTGSRSRFICVVLGLLWAWVAWAFLWGRYATINWIIGYVVWLFAAEMVLLIWIGALRGGVSFQPRRNAAGVIGVALFSLSLFIYPAIAPLQGRGWAGAEVFGVMPDPTVIGTLGLLLLAKGRLRGALLVIPVLWCLLSGATLWAMRA